MGPVANLPVELASVAEPLRADDELLAADELKDLFGSFLKRAPSFEKFPGSTVLRHGTPGRLFCSQGDAGATAFYILTTENILKLRTEQLKAIEAALIPGATVSDARLGDYTRAELLSRQAELSAEVAQLDARVAALAAASDEERHVLRQVASVNLLVDMGGNRPRRGLLHRLVDAFRSRRSDDGERSQMISIDAPVNIDSRLMKATLSEGELFGEMSCINRAPRSATVIAEQDCYMLEMLRNVLDMLHKDAQFKQQIDDTYRRRVLEAQIRSLPLFESISDAEFAELSTVIRLEEFPSGNLLFEEGDASDCFYIIRSGLVKVVKNAGTLFRTGEIPQFQFPALCRDLCDGDDPLRRALRSALPAAVSSLLETCAAGHDPDPSEKQSIVEGLNGLIGAARLHTALGKTTEEIRFQIESAEIATALIGFPEETENWSHLEVRTFHRLLIEHLSPDGAPRRMATRGERKTLAYNGRGELIGEMGVLLNEPRSATCVAYDHPDSGFHQRIPDSRTGAVPSRLELLRIDAEPFRKLLATCPKLKQQVESIVARRQAQDAERLEQKPVPRDNFIHSQEFDRLGLVQGQKLMLIDLERCTRCGACVEACVKAHHDGFTRLYLDGPRFEKYLVPLTCRKCLDPVCMIGCPVGAINRGDNGEIVIRDWCIGCRVCAEQCPYGSIQMNDVQTPVDLAIRTKELLEPGATLKAVDERAVVCDLCSSLPSQDPACVYACPHDAAFRVNAQEFLFHERSGR